MPAHPTTTTQARRRRKLPRLLIIAATASLTGGLVAGPSPASAKPKAPTSACKPGDITTVGKDKYVCNKKGKWVHVLYLVAGTQVATQVNQVALAPTTPTAPTTAPTTVSVSAPAANLVTTPGTGDTASDPTVTYLDNGPGPVTCTDLEHGVVLQAGDTMTVRIDTYDDKGNYQHQEIHTYICGNDGKLHEVGLIANATVNVSLANQVVQVQPQQPTTTALPVNVAATAAGVLR